jgi:hypothetical protein
MAAPIPEKDPTIRYLAVLGVNGMNMGTCPGCNHNGKVGNFYYPCCKVAGMMIGTCPDPDCEELGPIGLLCQDCGNAEYVGKIPMRNVTKFRSEVSKSTSDAFVSMYLQMNFMSE